MAASNQSPFSLVGETALVTGGTRGIGKSTALALAQAGAKVLFAQVCSSMCTTYPGLPY